MKRALALLLSGSLAAAAVAPAIAAARTLSPMPCCENKKTAMACCAADGGCSMRSCSGRRPTAQIAALAPFVVPDRMALSLPAPTSIPRLDLAALTLSTVIERPDPPPRG